MFRLVNHPLFGEVMAWVLQDANLPMWKVGNLLPDQVWAQFDPEGPYRPAWIV